MQAVLPGGAPAISVSILAGGNGTVQRFLVWQRSQQAWGSKSQHPELLSLVAPVPSRDSLRWSGFRKKLPCVSLWPRHGTLVILVPWQPAWSPVVYASLHAAVPQQPSSPPQCGVSLEYGAYTRAVALVTNGCTGRKGWTFPAPLYR